MKWEKKNKKIKQVPECRSAKVAQLVVPEVPGEGLQEHPYVQPPNYQGEFVKIGKVLSDVTPKKIRS